MPRGSCPYWLGLEGAPASPRLPQCLSLWAHQCILNSVGTGSESKTFQSLVSQLGCTPTRQVSHPKQVKPPQARYPAPSQWKTQEFLTNIPTIIFPKLDVTAGGAHLQQVSELLLVHFQVGHVHQTVKQVILINQLKGLSHGPWDDALLVLVKRG